MESSVSGKFPGGGKGGKRRESVVEGRWYAPPPLPFPACLPKGVGCVVTSLRGWRGSGKLGEERVDGDGGRERIPGKNSFPGATEDTKYQGVSRRMQ